MAHDALGAVGVRAVFGEPLDGVAVTAAGPAIAPLLALAHERLFGGLAAVHLGGGEVVVGGRRALDPAAPPPPMKTAGAPSWPEVAPDLLARLGRGRCPVVLAGPGVVAAGAAPGLHALATAARLGVLNTWGAKGVFDWHSRHHLATVGLQELDLSLGGMAGADPLITVGLDPLEVQGGVGLPADAVELEPALLSPLAEAWSRSGEWPEMPLLRRALAAVTQAGWDSTARPLPPSRATRTYSEVVGSSGGSVAADPGTAGYWVARTYPTSRLGEATVAAEPAPGVAVACALLARRANPFAAALAVVDGPLKTVHAELIELARRLDVGFLVEVWDQDGPALDADEHRERLSGALLEPGPTVVHLATDPEQLGRMTEVAGSVVAWDGLVARHDGGPSGARVRPPLP